MEKTIPAPHERMEAARKLAAMQKEGLINDAMLGQRFTSMLENPRAQEEGGAIDIKRAGMHRLDAVMMKMSSGHLLGLRPGITTKATDVLSSAFSTVSGTGQPVLARVDLEPIIYNWFLRKFPALDRIAKERSNGLNHTWDLSTSFDEADATFMAELDKSPLGQGVYGQASTNIAILATTRGNSYKEQLAVAQSGMTYDGGMDTVDLELQRGAWALAKTFQTAFYQGTTITGKTGTDEYGKTYTNGFNGLRALISTNANTISSGFYPTGFSPLILDKSATGGITASVNTIAQQSMDLGGEPSAAHMSAYAATQLALEASSGGYGIRFTMDDVQGGLVMGNTVKAIDTVAGQLPVVVIPGNSIGTYTAPAGTAFAGTTVEDIYVLDESTLSFPFLGSAVPTTIEIPMGVDLTLAKRYILFWMAGFAMKIPVYNGKVRIQG